MYDTWQKETIRGEVIRQWTCVCNEHKCSAMFQIYTLIALCFSGKLVIFMSNSYRQVVPGPNVLGGLSVVLLSMLATFFNRIVYDIKITEHVIIDCARCSMAIVDTSEAAMRRALSNYETYCPKTTTQVVRGIWIRHIYICRRVQGETSFCSSEQCL